MRRSRKQIASVGTCGPLVIVLLTLSGAWLGPGVQACPMCSQSLPDAQRPAAAQTGAGVPSVAADAGSLALGFYYSIVFMLAVPFLMMVALGSMLILSARKAAVSCQSRSGLEPINRLPGRSDTACGV